MNDIALKNNTAPKFKAAVVTFSIIALVAQIIVFIAEFFNERLGNILSILDSRESLDSIFRIWIKTITSDMLFTLVVFMAIYAVVIHKKPIANKIILVICIIRSFIMCCSAFVDFFYFVANSFYLLRTLFVISLYILAAIGYGTKTKILSMVAISIVLLINLFYILLDLKYVFCLPPVLLILILFGALAELFFNLALLFAGLGCGSGQEKPRELSVEEKLRFLNESLSRGEISFEAYNQQRAEILGRL